jgi:hypothetical protein
MTALAGASIGISRPLFSRPRSAMARSFLRAAGSWSFVRASNRGWRHGSHHRDRRRIRSSRGPSIRTPKSRATARLGWAIGFRHNFAAAMEINRRSHSAGQQMRLQWKGNDAPTALPNKKQRFGRFRDLHFQDLRPYACVRDGLVRQRRLFARNSGASRRHATTTESGLSSEQNARAVLIVSNNCGGMKCPEDARGAKRRSLRHRRNFP